MPKTKTPSVPAFLALYPAPIRKALKRVRDTIRKTFPDGEESLRDTTVSYDLVFFGERYSVIAFGTWTRWWSIYAADISITKLLKRHLKKYVVHNSTIRIAYDDEPPEELVVALVQLGYEDAVRRVQLEWYSD